MADESGNADHAVRRSLYGAQRAMGFLGDTPGVMVATISYPFTGDPRPDAVTFLREIPKIRAAISRHAARGDARAGLSDEADRR